MSRVMHASNDFVAPLKTTLARDSSDVLVSRLAKMLSPSSQETSKHIDQFMRLWLRKHFKHPEVSHISSVKSLKEGNRVFIADVVLEHELVSFAATYSADYHSRRAGVLDSVYVYVADEELLTPQQTSVVDTVSVALEAALLHQPWLNVLL